MLDVLLHSDVGMLSFIALVATVGVVGFIGVLVYKAVGSEPKPPAA